MQIPPSAGCFGYIYASLFNYEYVILILSGSSSYRRHIQQAEKRRNESEPVKDEETFKKKSITMSLFHI